MNSKIYVFGNFNGRYSQYPDDYTKKIFSTFYNGIQVDRQIITHRHGNLVYYGYICKLDSSHGKDYIGFCIVVNDIMFIRLDKLFSLFEDLIANLITNKYIIARNTKNELVTNLNVPLGQKDDKILPYINNFIDSHLQQFNNSDYVKLPPVSYDISKEEKKYLTLDSRYDKNREEVVTAVSKYDYTWITTRRDEAAFKSKTTQIEQERWEKKERRKEKIRDIWETTIGLIIIGLILWGLIALIVFGVNSCRSCSRDKTETPAETATETPMEETMTMTAVETPMEIATETPAETARETPMETENKYSEKDKRRAVAYQGNAEAQNKLGDCYYFGEGVAQDYQEAVKWFTLAAKQGLAKAQCNLGHCYEYGRGVDKDYYEAVKWYKLAAKQGNEFAQEALQRLGENY